MESLRTPESQFENLSGFDYEPHYLQEDQGEALAQVVVRFVEGIT